MSSPVATGAPAQPGSVIISRCDQPFLFGFGTWEKAKTAFPATPDGIHISAKNGQGGAGVAGLNLKLAEFGDWTPALTLAVGEQNKAGHAEPASSTMPMAPATSSSSTCARSSPALPQQVVADYGASLAEPQIVEKPGTTPGLGWRGQLPGHRRLEWQRRRCRAVGH